MCKVEQGKKGVGCKHLRNPSLWLCLAKQGGSRGLLFSGHLLPQMCSSCSVTSTAALPLCRGPIERDTGPYRKRPYEVSGILLHGLFTWEHPGHKYWCGCLDMDPGGSLRSFSLGWEWNQRKKQSSLQAKVCAENAEQDDQLSKNEGNLRIVFSWEMMPSSSDTSVWHGIAVNQVAYQAPWYVLHLWVLKQPGVDFSFKSDVCSPNRH